MANILIRAVRAEDIPQLARISFDATREGTLPHYLLQDKTRFPTEVRNRWMNEITRFIHWQHRHYTCMVAEAETPSGEKEAVGYCVWEWVEYDHDGSRVNEREVPVKLEKIWDEHVQGYRKPAHEPNYTTVSPQHYDPKYAAAIKTLKPRWAAADYSTGWSTAHQRLRTTGDVIDFSESWQITCLAVDPAYEGQGVEETLVGWGLRIAEAVALWVIVVHPDAGKGFYEGLGFESRETYVSSVEGDDEKFSLARLRRIPQSAT